MFLNWRRVRVGDDYTTTNKMKWCGGNRLHKNYIIFPRFHVKKFKFLKISLKPRIQCWMFYCLLLALVCFSEIHPSRVNKKNFNRVSRSQSHHHISALIHSCINRHRRDDDGMKMDGKRAAQHSKYRSNKKI